VGESKVIYSLDDPKIHQPFAKAPYFKPWEFRCRDSENPDYKGPLATVIKIDMRLVDMLQKMRVNIGRPITITSGYRTAAYNDFVGGSKSSRHILGQAVDIQVEGVATDIVATYAYMVGARRIGIANTFTHMDTGPGEAYWVYNGVSPGVLESWKKQINQMFKGHTS